jgi:trans-aconitate methyltransferase
MAAPVNRQVPPNMRDRWNPNLYDDRHAFVHKMGAGVIELLAPQPGERILDLGCGTGHLTRQIADVAAEVVGVDRSPSMVAEASRLFPGIRFEVADATTMVFDRPFDAVFSNAALHWVRPPEAAIARVHAALVPGGRFVLEMGGIGNVATILDATDAAGCRLGLDLSALIHANYFPSMGDYTNLLDRAGFETASAMLFDRPTPLVGDTGIRDWLRMFRPAVIEAVGPARIDEFFTDVEQRVRPTLFKDGGWFADYRRLRVRAVRKS